MSRGYILIGAVVALLFVALNAVYIVDERKQAIVLQFGQIKEVRTEERSA